jgi:hypothetical protein
MRMVHAVPAALVERVGVDQPLHIAYAEAINDDTAYLEFFTEALIDRKFVILSSVHPSGPNAAEDLIEAAVRLRPSEIVLPNIPAHPEKSARLTAGTSALLQSAGISRTPFMAVPHGEDFHDYLNETSRLSSFSQVRTIGVTVDVFEKYHLTRKKFFAEMRKMCPRTMHLLGLTADLADLKDPLSRSAFRSCNTSKAVTWGLAGVPVNPQAKRIPPYTSLGRGFLSLTVDDDVKIEQANKNIEEWDNV